MNAGAEIRVTGLVQGVGFRFFATETARRLRLNGFVKNLANGDVLVVAEGDRGMIEELIRALRRGPRSAHVADVVIAWKKPEYQFTGFDIR